MSQSITTLVNRIEDACTQIRIVRPLTMAGFEVKVLKKVPSGVVGPAYLIARSFPSKRDFDSFVQQLTQSGYPFVYEIDDLLIALPPEHPERKNHSYTPALGPIYRAIGLADSIVVPTNKLKESLSALNPNIFVVPNYFDDGLWSLRPPTLKENNSIVEIGFMGSFSHLPDIEEIVPSLLRILDRHLGKVKLKFWSLEPPPALRRRTDVEYIPPVSYEYINFAEYFQTQSADIFIAPLADNLFNRCKSPIKFFEYSALGSPGIYANLEPYNGIVIDKTNGMLANTPDEWEAALNRLVTDPELRYRLACNAQKSIRNDHLLSKNLSSITLAYQKAFTSKRIPATMPKDPLLNQIWLQIQEQSTAFVDSQKEAERLKQDLTVSEKSNNDLEFELREIKRSKIYKIGLKARSLRMKVAPPSSLQSKLLVKASKGLIGVVKKIKRGAHLPSSELYCLPDASSGCQILSDHPTIDLIICVHNALEDVKKCLKSVLEHTSNPFKLILVDDGSDEATKNYLLQFSETNSACLLRNEHAQGYTKAANLGMSNASSDYFVLLNSDTVVTPMWLERLYSALMADPLNAVAGPLSNTASWQSIPDLSAGSDWAINPLPEGVSIADYASWVAKYSACIRPNVPLLNGFCLLIKRQIAEELCFFDEHAFPKGYGEEDDFNLRAGKLGYKKVIADDTFVFHAQSKSFSTERRLELSKLGSEALAKKHGSAAIASAVEFMNPNRVLEGIRARASVFADRELNIQEGRKSFEGKKILFVLPVMDAGGGANVIVDEALVMNKMGVGVSIFNLSENRDSFNRNYEHTGLPIIYASPDSLPWVSKGFDAVIASAFYSVPWLESLQRIERGPILGYYVQDYEPMMQNPGSTEETLAKQSYSRIPGMVLFTKTNWNYSTLYLHTGVKAKIVGISINSDLFRPRVSRPMGKNPLRIAAMIRPVSLYRNPNQTLRILSEVKSRFPDKTEIILFGSDQISANSIYGMNQSDFTHCGKLRQTQVASLMSDIDVFVDFSTHQAMGLTALEAMAAGATVIVPSNGGAIEFVEHEKNGLVVDTSNFNDCVEALSRLVEDVELRKKMQLKALKDVVQYHPEGVALRILKALFGDG